MKADKVKRNIVLGILFFLPVAFLLMLYPAKHNYEPLNVVNEKVSDTKGFYTDRADSIVLKNHITVLGFLGKSPLDKMISASNLKELVYDKFKEINTYEHLKFWHYAFGTEGEIKMLFNTLKSKERLSEDLSTNNVFIIDKDLNQRGRIDGRTEREIEDKKPAFSVYSYNTIEVSEIKNMMSDDVRVLFTEYRQKREGKFDDSNTRRSKEIKKDNE